jgi:hypothetical protein
LLRERSPDDITGQIFQGFFFSGMDTGAAKDLKTGMPPRFQQINMIRSNLPFRQKEGKDLRSEEFFQMFKFNGRGDLK